ncbi:MAG: outer membrane beta-barrel protein [Spirochaetales bacterium]|nr:outer membrane beta-barrel protein [Spirochaetales bacterium]
MKNKLTLIVMLLFIAASGTLLFAQDWTDYSPAFEEGDMAIQAGIGLIPTFGYGDSTVPPISVGFEYATPVADLPLSFGGLIGYSASKDEYSYWSYSWSYKYSYILIGARASWHVDLNVENLDTYAGVMLGYNVVTVTVDGDDTFASSSASGSSLIYGGYIGARYFFTENIAAFGELGYGMGVLTLGATFKL